MLQNINQNILKYHTESIFFSQKYSDTLNNIKVHTKSLGTRQFFSHDFFNCYSFLLDRGQKALCYIWKERK